MYSVTGSMYIMYSSINNYLVTLNLIDMKQNMYTIFDANSEFIFGFLFSIIITCGIGCAFINYMVNYYYDIDSVSSLRARATLSEPVSHSIPAFLKVIFPHSMHELMNSSSNNSTQNITSLSNYSMM